MTVPALEVKLIETRRERAAVQSHQANASRGGTPEPLKGTALLRPRRLPGAGCRPARSIPGGSGWTCWEPLPRVAPPLLGDSPRAAPAAAAAAAWKSPRYEILFALAAGIPALYITLMRFKEAIGLTAAQKAAPD